MTWPFLVPSGSGSHPGLSRSYLERETVSPISYTSSQPSSNLSHNQGVAGLNRACEV